MNTDLYRPDKTFSIITVCLNAESTIRSCVDSIRSQSITAEHLIVDGGSGDRTLDVLRDYTQDNLKIYSEPDQGIYDAMNKGIAKSTGEIIGILNSDDYFANQNVLEKILSKFDDKTVDACYGDLVYVDAADANRMVRYWKAGAYKPSRFYWGWMPPHPTCFIRRRVYEQFGVFDTRMGSSADYELLLRFMLKHRIKVEYVPETLVYMRTGGASNASMANRVRAHLMDYRAWKVNQILPYPWTLPLKPLSKLGQWFGTN